MDKQGGDPPYSMMSFTGLSSALSGVFSRGFGAATSASSSSYCMSIHVYFPDFGAAVRLLLNSMPAWERSARKSGTRAEQKCNVPSS